MGSYSRFRPPLLIPLFSHPFCGDSKRRWEVYLEDNEPSLITPDITARYSIAVEICALGDRLKEGQGRAKEARRI
jgi:hypothetical protein